jgi:DNA-binding XRE family transcriptional regulator
MENMIEEPRKTRGVRQDELAKVLGLSRQTISSR